MASSPVAPSRRRTVRLRRWLWRWRHLTLGAALVLTGWVLVNELRPPQPATAPVVVLAREVPAGARLAAADVRTAQVPLEMAGPHVVENAAAVVGERLAVGLPEGFPLTDRVLVGPGLAQAVAAGQVVVPVRLADAGVSASLRPGDRIDLLAATADTAGGAGGAQVVAAAALVMALQDDGGGGLLAADQSTSLVFVAVPSTQAPAIVGASAWAPLRVVLAG